jgi:hypothetical protein
MSENRLRELMQNLHTAHQEFKKAWVAWERVGLSGKEPKEVSLTRNKLLEALNLLYSTKLDPLRNNFLRNGVYAVEDVIDFLSIDIPAFRCGYEKEWYLRRLKSVSLSVAQQERLKTIALDLAGKPDYRREFSDWAKLMVLIADKTFIEELEGLLESPDEYVQKKARRMLNIIFENRKDLKAKMLVSA